MTPASRGVVRIASMSASSLSLVSAFNASGRSRVIHRVPSSSRTEMCCSLYCALLSVSGMHHPLESTAEATGAPIAASPAEFHLSVPRPSAKVLPLGFQVLLLHSHRRRAGELLRPVLDEPRDLVLREIRGTVLDDLGRRQ